MKLDLIAKYENQTQQEIIETLKVFDECTVVRYELTGREEVLASVGIKSHYSEEEKTARFEIIQAKELFTPKERNDNYKETFGYDRYPQFR